MSRNFSVLHRLGLYGLLILAPFLLGSNRPLFWGINGVIAALTVAIFAWSEFARSNSSRFDWHLAQVALVGMLIIGIWIIIQASPWTPKTWHHPIWFASPMLADARGTISADPSLTWQTLGWWSTLSIFVVAVDVGTNASRGIFLLKLMLAVCVLVAAFGFIVEIFQLRTVGLLPKTYYQGYLTGTFVNRNSAATFIVIGLVVALTLATREGMFRWPPGKILPRRAADNATFYRAAMFGAVAVGLFIVLLLTGSRGGIIAGLIGGSSVFVMRISKLGRVNTSQIAVVLAILVISTVLAVNVIQERPSGGESTSIRLSLYAEAFKAINDRPILGHGAGAYASIQPLYHSPSTPSDLIWDNAHSTVLEVILTLGIPAVLFATIVLAYIFSRLARTWWNSTEEATCLLAALSVGAAVGFHSFIDFSLEIQAIAIYVACLLGLGMGEMMSRRTERSKSATQNAELHLLPRKLAR
jgi:O-antigen ligase